MEKFNTYDFIIVGGGTAGCVIANRLSKNVKNRVLLIEGGGDDNYIWAKIPVGYLFCNGNPRTDWCFKTEKEKGLNGRSLNYPRGKILGGCSAINGMIYMRGQSRDYDQWQQLGNHGWSWDDVLPYFKKSEDYFSGATDYHGEGGEWRVEELRDSWEILDAFKESCFSWGLPKIDDFNKGNNEGVSYFKVNQKRGWRWSSSTGFLKPISKRNNLTILTNTHVEGLVICEKNVKGVKFRKGNNLFYAEAKTETILSAGAIGTPHILQLSGIGPAKLLNENGIQVTHELNGVGRNLQDHLQIRTVYKVKGIKTLNENYSSIFSKIKFGLEYLLKQSGPMSSAPSQLGAFLKSDPSLETPNLQYHVQPLSLDKFGDPLHNFPAFTAAICNLRPESRGKVEIKSPDPYKSPLISPNYLSTLNDKLVAAKSIKITREIVNKKPIKNYIQEEYLPGSQYTSDKELAEQAGNIGTTIFHPVGTCKMGNDKMSVVNNKLKVHGLKGLRIADASIMPEITSGNTNSPTLMIAERAADFIIKK